MFRTLVLSLLTGVVSLGIWAALGLGANFGVHPVLATVGMLWLATAGIPASVGVAVAATIWGHADLLSGLKGFLVLSAALGLALQFAAVFLLRQAACRARATGRPWQLGRMAMAAAMVGLVGWMVLWITHSPVTLPPRVIDGHAHLFGDAGWPPVHGKTSGLSPAQKSNPTYATLMRLLRLPPTGDVDTLYVEELVRQAREARQTLGSFRVVLLAQDCRYTESGEPDWDHSTVYVPNARLFQVVSNHADLFLPCPSINPQRKDWQTELDYCLAQGARVLKIHPPTQAVDPSHPRFREFYRRCALAGMRIMVHTGSEHSAPIASATLGDPRLVQLALDEGCTVIAAHAGTKAFFDPPGEDHFQDLVAMMARYPRLYADTAVLGSQFRWRCVPSMVRTDSVLTRMLHASDWPFPANSLVFWHRLHPFTVVELMAERNLFVRDARLKFALGMPPESFERIGDMLGEKSAAP